MKVHLADARGEGRRARGVEGSNASNHKNRERLGEEDRDMRAYNIAEMFSRSQQF